MHINEQRNGCMILGRNQLHGEEQRIAGIYLFTHFCFLWLFTPAVVHVVSFLLFFFIYLSLSFLSFTLAPLGFLGGHLQTLFLIRKVGGRKWGTSTGPKQQQQRQQTSQPPNNLNSCEAANPSLCQRTQPANRSAEQNNYGPIITEGFLQEFSLAHPRTPSPTLCRRAVWSGRGRDSTLEVIKITLIMLGSSASVLSCYTVNEEDLRPWRLWTIFKKINTFVFKNINNNSDVSGTLMNITQVDMNVHCWGRMLPDERIKGLEL